MRENANPQSGEKTDLYLGYITGFNISTMKDKPKMHKKLNKFFSEDLHTKANNHASRHPTLVTKMKSKTSIIWHFPSLRIDNNNCWQDMKKLESSLVSKYGK